MLKTIAESKRAFHQAFPFVIPALYRRLVDELLVELHLLSHQKGFSPDTLFAIGLVKVFEDFTTGYRPKENREKLFWSLCKSTGFDPDSIRQASDKAIAVIKEQQLEDLKANLIDKEKPQNVSITRLFGIEKLNSSEAKYYSRLTSIGIYNIYISTKDYNKDHDNTSDSISQGLSNAFGLPADRVEKDIKQYKSNLDKMNQAIELMNEAIAREKRKKIDK